MKPWKCTRLSVTLLNLGLLLFLPAFAFAQDKPVFAARADARQVVMGGFFEVVFSLKNASGDDFQAPDFGNFQVISGPNGMRSTSIVNGRVSREMGFSYTLAPRSMGKFTIGSASIVVNGRVMRSKPLTIEVLKARKGNANGGNDIFLRAELSEKEIYPGQQVLLDYKIYFRNKSIEAYDVIQEGDYQGFFARDIRRFDSGRTQEVINGQQYTVATIKRVALFPQQIGQLTIEGMSIQLGILEDTPASDGFPSLFFNRQLIRVTVSSEPLSIAVKPLPDNAPKSFCGGVGRFDMVTGANRNELSTDDALSVRMAIRGDGDSKRIQAPSGIFPPAFEVYDPKVVEENSFDQNGRLMSEKVFEYLLLPKTPGTYTIAPEVAVFDPEKRAYTTLKGDAFNVTVSQGKGIKKPVEPDGFEALQEDGGGNFSKTTYALWLLGMLVVLAAGVFWWRKKYNKKPADPLAVAETPLERAEKIAKTHLSTANEHLQKGKSEAFYEEISRALLGYACRKFDIPLSELNRENLRQKLQQTSLPQAQIEQFSKIIHTSDMALYAGMDNAVKMEETYQNAQTILVEMERFLK